MPTIREEIFQSASPTAWFGAVCEGWALFLKGHCTIAEGLRRQDTPSTHSILGSSERTLSEEYLQHLTDQLSERDSVILALRVRPVAFLTRCIDG